MDYYAHISESGHRQSVVEHLQQTGDLCAQFARAFGNEEQGKLIGLAHDIGKCSAEFQKRLLGGNIVDHSSAGALECAKMNLLWAACCIAGHHSGLPDVGNIRNDTQVDSTLYGRLQKALHGGIPSYDLPFPLKPVAPPEGYGQNSLNDSFIIRMLYSCLVDADYLDTESFMSEGNTERDKGEALEVLQQKLNHFIDPWWHPSTELNRKRCDILRECINRGKEPKGFYTLTVPTGGGKTIASVAFALSHAVSHGMDRIIYVIPYTSIIEQTADVFRGVFGTENVVEHHSNVDYETKDDHETSLLHQKRATENWDAPIIVTTAVQFFESMYANRSSKCRKLHNITNSVVIFDEAQMMPTTHLRPCIAAISKLVTIFHSTVLLCTATQPYLKDLFSQYVPNFQSKELCPGTDELFNDLRRVSYRNIGETDIDFLSDELNKLPQVLCIVNSRKAAQELYQRLHEEGSYHLSTLMVPAHRKRILAEIRIRLKKDKPCRLISTSLIEAGVDVDFPYVYREIAGLDSILQAAGRCNREGKRDPDKSIVTIFSGVSTTPKMLKINIGATVETLKPGIDPGAPETIQKYFNAYRSLCDKTLDKNHIIEAFEKGVLGCSYPFRTVAERFHLIDENTQTVYVPIEEGEKILERLRNGEHSRSLFRQLGQYSINIYEHQYRTLLEQGALESIDEHSAILIHPNLYHMDIGLALQSASEANWFV